MKKILLPVFLSVIFINCFFGQIPFTPAQQQSIPKIAGFSKNSNNPAVPPERTCGTMEADSMLRALYPGLGTLQDFENWLQKKIAEDKESGLKMPPVYTIPVIVHIIHNGEAVGSGSNISQTQVNSQIDVLNEDFRKTNTDASLIPSVFQSVSADAEIQFCAAVVDPNGNTLTQPGIDRVNRNTKGFSAPPYTQTYTNSTIKPNTYWDPTKYFNIWVLNLGNSLLGYAQFPSNSGLSGLNANGGAANTDGIVVLYTAFGRVGNVSAPYNKGRTATHEAGHWIGLRHIWGDGNCATDYCNDTPTADQSHSGCPTHPYHTNTCGGGTSPNGEMFMNYMDYTNDACMYMFTSNQRTRMRTVMQNSPRRVELITSTVCNTNSPPVCGFTASSFTVTAGGSINYTDQSGGSPTSWSWTFQGGTPGTSTQQNPSGIVYNTAGTYNTTLIATNTFGSCTLTQQITVVANVGCDTLNYPPPGTLVTYIGGNGYVCGWNTTYKDQCKAEYFAGYSPYTHVTGGLVYFRKAYWSSGSNATVTFNVWNDSGTGGSPGTVLGSKTITLQSLASVIPSSGALYQVIFDSPIQVTTPFYFGINMQNFTNNDSLGVVSNTNGDSNPNTAWEQWSVTDGAGWYAFNNSNSWGISISQFMSPFMTNLPPNAVLSASDTSECVGSAITFNGSASTNTNSYNWTFNGGTPSASTTATQAVTYNSAGTYTAVLTVGGSCQGSDKDSIINIVISPNPTVAATANNISCNGGNNGTATATPSGGTSPYSYSWSNGQTSAIATGLTAGTYTVTVTDNKGCNGTASVAVTQPSALSVSVTSTNTTCGGTNGTATATPSGGVSPYSYLWNNGQTTAIATGLIAGTYTVTVTDNNGCTQTASTTVSSVGGGLSATTSVNNISCNGANNGTATATPSGGVSPYSYSWSTTPSQTTQTATGLAAGTYSVTITDVSSCSAVQSVTVTEPPALSLSNSQTNGTCASANGSATVSASGGTTAYSYSWNNGQTAATATGLAAGSYTVTVTDANNCTATSAFTITNAAGPTLTMSSTNITCNGSSNGTATANASGGTTPITYNWSNGAVTSSISNLSAGTYTVTVTDANNCTASSSVTITQPTALNSSANASNASCNGVCNGALSALASGGTSPYTYNWSGGLGSGATVSNVCAGNYTVTITDSNNCTSSAGATVNQPAAIVLASSSTQAICGNPNGTATVNASGGAGGFTYLWNNGQTDSTATGLIAGTYTVTVTDAASCTNSTNVNVSNDIPTSLTVSATNVSCNGGNNGTATATPSGGALPYSYSWSNGATGATITGLIAGTYTVTVTDANGCSAISTATINQPAAISLNPSQINVSCNGGNTGSASVNVTGGTSPYTYNWSNGLLTQSIASLQAGTYTITVTDSNNCTSTNTFTISEPSSLFASVTATAATCNGICNGTLSASGSGGTSPYIYNWSGSLGSGANKSNVCAGNYTVTVTDANNCTSTANATVTQPSAINLSTNSANATCGVSNGSASVSATGGAGGFTYLWNTGSANSSITGLSAGTYTVTVTDASNCTGTTSITVINPGAPAVTVSSGNVSCNGGCNGTATATVSGGASPYTYNWNNGQTASTATGLCAGNYSVTVTDNNSCAASASVTVTEPAPLNVTTSTTNSICTASNGSATATASGGTTSYSYLWSNGMQTQSIASLPAGNYSVTVTDVNNCTQTATATVGSSASSMTANVSVTDVSCNGGNNGTATASAASGASPFTYLWNTGGQTQSIVSLQAGNYSVTVTDANGCTATASATISEPSAITSSISSTNATCSGNCDGTGTITASGGISPYSYLWNNGETTATAISLCVGNANVTITDNSGCNQSNSAVIGQNMALTLNLSGTNPTVTGGNDGTATAAPVGGSSPYTYLWNNGMQTQSIASLPAGIYCVTITDNSGCTADSCITLNDPACNMSLSMSSTPDVCGDSSGTATATPVNGTSPFSYLWNTNAGSQTTQTATGLPPGGSNAYGVLVVDAAGCNASNATGVGGGGPINANTSTTNADCNASNGSATVTVSGGGNPPYFYSWSNGMQTQSIASLPAGIYTVTVTDFAGCTFVISDTVNPNAGITLTASSIPSQCGGNNGLATVAATGGVSPYDYLWNTGGQTQSIVSLQAGNYTITVTDINGCLSETDVTVGGTTPLSLNTVISNENCGKADGVVIADASGGTAPYNYLWSDAKAQTAQVVTGLSAGTYSVTVTDGDNCNSVFSLEIINTSNLVINVLQAAGGHCGSNNGTVASSASGGPVPYSYLWSDANAQANSTATGLAAGDYSVTITDSAGCKVVGNVFVGSSPMSVSDSVIDETCDGKNDGTISLKITGGTAPYSYTWSNGSNQSLLSNLKSQTYFVTVTDFNGCTLNDTVYVGLLEEDGCLSIPTGFTPNGDGKNDTWKIRGIGSYPDILVEVFNRWGSLVFSSKGYTQAWDGTNNGNELPAAAYYYIINLGNGEVKTGSVTVVR